MSGAWQRLGEYLDLREDPDLPAQGKAEQSRHRVARGIEWLLGAALGFAVFIVFFCAVALVVHLISGDTNPRDVLVDGLRFFGLALTIAMAVFFLGRWLYWFADRWIQKS